ncbi:unnamed protein product [Penicillium salamii]|uniref:DNA2/NAM7 helicase-like C-terminal domain-containing protein n=1 Tax=Penicillium salamii TaxID=1612424 RepID=A0A9W4IRS4_9EURO|nr:unnamed protein product [Penicillium salamii]CAG8194914.1 unnamed protein product [Penicillium salamii]CAG8201975.1 unnamed protein product [Penicillium salamii]CAG8206805.1 unnamed protein product [Penicillium salamii]CAG8328975.1 unnamed protein product [Penicillium salamii]
MADINVKARIVLLDSEGNAFGDSDNNEEVPAVLLHFFFHNDPYENRIDVRIAHRREKGSKKQAPAESMIFRIYEDQIKYLKKWLIVESANPTESVPAFTQVIAHLANDSEATTIPPFSQLCNMKFDEGLESLLSEKRLWLAKLKMTSEGEGSCDTRRHGVGLFAKLKDYGTKTATMTSIRKIFEFDDEFYFIVKRADFDQMINDWANPPIVLIPPPRIAENLFPKHVNQPFLQKSDHPEPSDLEGYFPERCESVFRDVQEYNMVIGWGAILDQQAQAQINGNGNVFKGMIQVYSVTRDDEYLAIIDLQSSDEIDTDAPERLQTGSRFNVRWYTPDATVLPSDAMMNLEDQTDLSPDPSVDTWSATVVLPASFCPINCWTVILRRPSKETPGATQPRVITLPRDHTSFTEKNVESEDWDVISYQLHLSTKHYDRFLSVNRDLVVKPVNKLIMDTLLGTNPSLLPIRNALEGIPQEHIQRVLDNIIVSNDFDLLLANVSAMHGPLYTVEGPAGTGKSHAMLALAMMDLGGDNFKYPVHSEDFPEDEWCSLFTNWHKFNQGETEPINVYNVDTRRQVVIMVATNSVANDITIKATDMSRKIFPDSQARIIRVHAVHIEKQVVERAYLKIANQSSPDHSGKSVQDLGSKPQVPACDESSGHNDNPADEEMSECNEVDDMEAIITDLRTTADYVNELTQHYSVTRPHTISAFEGVSDPRLKEISTSLGAAMLGVAGKIPGSPWAISGLGPYHDFDSFWKDREHKIEAEDEAAFQKDCRQMKRDALGIANIVIGTPAVITAPTILTCLHPSFVAVDEASMIRETDLHAAFAWFNPISFGLFGDSRQLGPHLSAAKDQNPFFQQVQMSLLERMSTAGHMAVFLRHQRRMTGDIQRLSCEVFYSDKTMVSAALDPEGKTQRIASWNMEKYKVNSNALILDVPWATEELIGTSFANEENRKVVLDLVGKLVRAGLSKAKDIAILVGYEAQWRLYLKDLHELAQTEQDVAWKSVRAFKIDAIQGNEADVVIFDYVRTGKQHGFIGAFRRLNVACSRGRFGFYLVGSARTLKAVPRFGYRTPSKIHKFFELQKAKASLDTPGNFTAGDVVNAELNDSSWDDPTNRRDQW